MSLKHALLGFLYYAPMSGYDLKKACDRSLGHFWPADQSQIYRTLSQLTTDDFVEKEVFERQNKLDRKVYYITEDGRDELHRWLRTPLKIFEPRNPFLMQLFFGGVVPDDEILRVLQAEMLRIEKRQGVYRSLYGFAKGQRKALEGQRQSFFNLLTLEQGLVIHQAYLGWLQSAVNRIEIGDYSATH